MTPYDRLRDILKEAQQLLQDVTPNEDDRPKFSPDWDVANQYRQSARRAMEVIRRWRDLITNLQDHHPLLEPGKIYTSKRLLLKDMTTISRNAGYEQHPDDEAVDNLADAMKAKLSFKRSTGVEGWQTMPVEQLRAGLRRHLEKGDPVDVANYCMMLHARGESTTSTPEAGQTQAKAPPQHINGFPYTEVLEGTITRFCENYVVPERFIDTPRYRQMVDEAKARQIERTVNMLSRQLEERGMDQSNPPGEAAGEQTA